MSTMTAERLRDHGIAGIRIMVGVVFLAHGYSKIFDLGVGGMAEFLQQQGIPFPMVASLLLIAAETVGGSALIVGFGTRIVALPLAFAMFVAITTVHLASGFFGPEGYEFPLTLMIASVGLALTGSGALSLDAMLARRALARGVIDGPAFTRLA